MLYAALIEEHLKEQKHILVNGKREFTYFQLHEGAMGFLTYFYQNGVQKGDRILIKNHNDERTIEAILACLAGGLIFVLVSNKCSEKEMGYFVKDCSPSMILEPSEVNNIDIVINREYKRTRIPESMGAYILYTSGTTGEKKGVYGCHKQIMFCCRSILSRLEYNESDKVLCSLSLEFDYGLYQIFLSLLSKAQIFLVESEMLQMIPRYLYQWEITVYPSIPSVMNLLLKLRFLDKIQLPYLRCITFTGEYLSVELIKRIREILPSAEVIPMYGVTECKRIAIMPKGHEDKVMAGSCGLPLDGVRVYLLKENSMDSVGELIVEGPNVMEGYWNEGDGFETNLKTGMKIYHTGDLMSIDVEGFLYFYGRVNGLIKIMGHRISEVEIENIVSSVTGVLECAVVGFRDDIYGEKIGICIYSKDENIKKGIQEILATRPRYMNSYELFCFSAPLPRNYNGKVNKIKLGKIINEKR